MEFSPYLNLEQKKAIQIISGPVLVFAGAGTGKTRTLTHRVAYLIEGASVSPDRILSVTFTNKAAGEMRERVRQLLDSSSQMRRVTSPLIGTFHSVGARILREDIACLGYSPHFTILDEIDQLKVVKQIIREMKIPIDTVHPKRLLSVISRAKEELIGPETLEKAYGADFDSRFLAVAFEVYIRYEEFLQNTQALDFGDLIFKTVQLLKKFKDVKEKYQKRWEYVLVDEYQDTNHAQYEFCRLLSEQNRNLFVVGDDYQSIYSFRGADIRNILEFQKDYPDASVIVLEQNYRSTKAILDCANRVIEKNNSQYKKMLWTNNTASVLPKIVEVADEQGEAAFIIETIITEARASKTEEVSPEYEYILEEPVDKGGILDKILASRIHGGLSKVKRHSRHASLYTWDKIDLNKFVVLYRTNAQSRALEEELLIQRMPYIIVGGVRFYERKEIKDIIAYLRILHNPRDVVALERIINVPSRGIGEKTWKDLVQNSIRYGNRMEAGFAHFLENETQTRNNRTLIKIRPFFMALQELYVDIPRMSVREVIDAVLDKFDYIQFLQDTEANSEDRIRNIVELKTVAERMGDLRGGEGIQTFLEEVALFSDTHTFSDSGNALTLMTVHSAKGLEYDTVFMIGMEQGLFPHVSGAESLDEYEEERRLCYVGITRARKELYLIYTRKRHLYGAVIFGEPSEFIRDLDESLVQRIVY